MRSAIQKNLESGAASESAAATAESTSSKTSAAAETATVTASLVLESTKGVGELEYDVAAKTVAPAVLQVVLVHCAGDALALLQQVKGVDCQREAAQP